MDVQEMSFGQHLQLSCQYDIKMRPLAKPYKNWTILLGMGSSKEKGGAS